MVPGVRGDLAMACAKVTLSTTVNGGLGSRGLTGTSIIGGLASARDKGTLDTTRNGILGSHVAGLNILCGIGNAGAFTRIVTLAGTTTKSACGIDSTFALGNGPCTRNAGVMYVATAASNDRSRDR